MPHPPMEDEAMDVIYHRLKAQQGISIQPRILDLTPHLEINLYGTDDGICLIGENSIRVDHSLVEEVLHRAKKLHGQFANYLREKIILVVYDLQFTEGASILAREKGVWLVTAGKDATPLVIHQTSDVLH